MVKETPKAVPKEAPKPVEKKADPKPATNQVKSITKVGGSQQQNELIAYAFARCGEDCVKTWQAESGWIVDRKSNTANSNGTRDYGLCQMNSQYHKDFIFKNKVNLQAGYSDAFLDPYKQLDRCIGIWNDAVKRGRIKTTFYAYNVRNTKGVLQSLEFHR